MAEAGSRRAAGVLSLLLLCRCALDADDFVAQMLREPVHALPSATSTATTAFWNGVGGAPDSLWWMRTPLGTTGTAVLTNTAVPQSTSVFRPAPTGDFNAAG